jgi:recombination protein RecA
LVCSPIKTLRELGKLNNEPSINSANIGEVLLAISGNIWVILELQGIIPREVGMYSTAINRLRETLRLNKVQKQVLIGSLLGDGYLYPTVSGKYSYLRIAHGPKQKDYVWWKYRYFKQWVLSLPRYQMQNKNKPGLGGYYWFKTIADKDLLSYRNIFYSGSEKIVPFEIGKYLVTPLSLAVWYMDDGTINYRALHLNTQGFSLEENKLLREVLNRNFGILCNINKSGGIGKGYILYIPIKQAKLFMSLVRSFVEECMPYKASLTP